MRKKLKAFPNYSRSRIVDNFKIRKSNLFLRDLGSSAEMCGVSGLLARTESESRLLGAAFFIWGNIRVTLFGENCFFEQKKVRHRS